MQPQRKGSDWYVISVLPMDHTVLIITLDKFASEYYKLCIWWSICYYMFTYIQQSCNIVSWF